MPGQDNREALLAILDKLRFTARVTRIGRDFGFARLTCGGIDVHLQSEIIDETIGWENLQVGELISCRVGMSRTYPGKLIARRVERAEIEVEFIS